MPNFAENQLVTSIVDAIRFLLVGQPVGNDIWIALAWCVRITFVAYVFALRAYKKRVSFYIYTDENVGMGIGILIPETMISKSIAKQERTNIGSC